jgi:hypothetical protein
MNSENLSEFVHFISNHCYKLHNKVVGASTVFCKCFYGNDREEFGTDMTGTFYLWLLLLLNYQDNQVITFNSAAS